MTPSPAHRRFLPQIKQPGHRLRVHLKNLLLLLVIGLPTHFIGLGHPDSVVFDEVHFGKFINDYAFTGRRLFDIHPPHAKLLIAGVARSAGYDGKAPFDHIGEPYGSSSAFALRLAPALSGVLLPLVIYGVVCLLGGGPATAFLAGMAIALDNAFTLQTRVIALDGILLLATFGSLSLFLWALRRPPGRARHGLLLLAGACAGMAVGSKFTGLVALALPFLYAVTVLARQFSWRALAQWSLAALVFLVGALAVYLAGWWLHFILLTQPGDGDAWGLPTGHFLHDLITLHQTMLSANMNLHATHPDASPWWGWPFMDKPIDYWGEGDALIYFIGNPVVWWLGGALFVSAVMALARTQLTKRRVPPTTATPINITLPLTGYVVAYAPLMDVGRVLFLYHYMMPLSFALIVVVLWLEREGIIRRGSIAVQRRSYFVALTAMAGGFILMMPLTYGTVTGSQINHWIFTLFPHWR